MKLFSAEQIRQWDQYTIQNEPVASIDLMERAAARCCDWIIAKFPDHQKYSVFCGPGNNGGDGLAIARMLIRQNKTVSVFILGHTGINSADFITNLARLQACTTQIELLEEENRFTPIAAPAMVIDALFGYGLNRPLEGLAGKLVAHINRSGAPVIAIDMPSGLFADKSSLGNTIIQSTFTLTFQQLKLAFLLPENAKYTGSIQVLDIGLARQYYEDTNAGFEIIEEPAIRPGISPRPPFSHKGTYGSVALIAGSHGMMGAAVLGARACMRSGAGKLTCYIPGCGYQIMQTTVPEAMCITGINKNHLSAVSFRNDYQAYAIGPGMGQDKSGLAVLETVLDKNPSRLIIDADGLNLLSTQPELYRKLPQNTILTPHPKEFEKLFGTAVNDFHRLQLALEKARALQVFIVLKGRYTFIATPEGKGYFNPTGNPGMATAGSGDVLTGILLGLYAQNANTEQVVLTGVFLHGMAGDIASEAMGEASLIAGDLIRFLPEAFVQVKRG